MDALNALYVDFPRYLVVLMRVASFLFALPIFGPGVPALAKLGLAGGITLILAPAVAGTAIPEELGRFAALAVEEVAVGLALGLAVTTILSAVHLAGQLIDIPIGFGMVNVIDPQTGMQVPVVAQFKFALSMLVLFTVNGHHALLAALGQSLVVLPPGFAALRPEAAGVGVDAFGAMFLLAARISLPIVAALFIADVVLGIVARAVPQINVFFVGIPLKIGVGVLLMILVLPVFVAQVAVSFGASGEMADFLARMLRALRPPVP